MEIELIILNRQEKEMQAFADQHYEQEMQAFADQHYELESESKNPEKIYGDHNEDPE